MHHDFIISGIEQEEIQHLSYLNEEELRNRGISKITVDEHPGYPCRLSLEDAEIGEEVFAFSYEHHKTSSPYQSSGPVFVRVNREEAQLKKNEIPKLLIHRYLSLRAYDQDGMMIDAMTTQGTRLAGSIQEILSNDQVDYIHIHNAKPGCYNCQVRRA